MRTVEGYLSRRAAADWPGAVVYYDPEIERGQYVLDRPGAETVALGSSHGQAMQSIRALAERARAEAEE